MTNVDISKELDGFFTMLDAAFPSGEIIWDNWDHTSWDKTALELCNALGYTSGAPFLTAYGYGIFVDGRHIPPTGSRSNKRMVSTVEVASKPEPVKAVKASKPAMLEQSKPIKSAEPHMRKSANPQKSEFFTGSVYRVLRYRNSGFVRKDGGGDYYFNVRDFTHRVELKPGMRVQFALKDRFDQKRNKMRLTAVELTAITK